MWKRPRRPRCGFEPLRHLSAAGCGRAANMVPLVLLPAPGKQWFPVLNLSGRGQSPEPFCTPRQQRVICRCPPFEVRHRPAWQGFLEVPAQPLQPLSSWSSFFPSPQLSLRNSLRAPPQQELQLLPGGPIHQDWSHIPRWAALSLPSLGAHSILEVNMGSRQEPRLHPVSLTSGT